MLQCCRILISWIKAVAGIPHMALLTDILLCTAHFRTLNTAHCTLHSSYCILHIKPWKRDTRHCTLHTGHCTLHTTHYTLHTAHFNLKNAHSTLHDPNKQENECYKCGFDSGCYMRPPSVHCVVCCREFL